MFLFFALPGCLPRLNGAQTPNSAGVGFHGSAALRVAISHPRPVHFPYSKGGRGRAAGLKSRVEVWQIPVLGAGEVGLNWAVLKTRYGHGPLERGGGLDRPGVCRV